MAEADNVTIYNAPNATKIADGLIQTNVLVWTDEYEAAALAATSTISIAVLPSNAKVWKVTLYIDALGTGVTIKIGDSDDEDRYLVSTSGASAGTLTSSAIAGVGYVTGTNDGDTTILVTVGGAAATGTIKSVVEYTLS